MKTKTLKTAIPDQQVGLVLYDVSKVFFQKELYSIVGMSDNETAMIRLFEQNELNPLLAKICYPLRHKVKIDPEPGNQQVQLYADTSRLIIKDHRRVGQFLSRHPERMLCKVYKTDINYILAAIQTIGTISKDTKNKYLKS